jgi:hypothetical protein
VSITVVHDKYGPADGYLADFSGRLARVDEPIADVDTASARCRRSSSAARSANRSGGVVAA